MKISRQILLSLFALSVILGSWLTPLDSPAIQQVDAGLKRALVTFATARLLTGVISAVQGTELSAHAVVVGVTLTPGQLLSPVHDLVKHFSDLMLAAAVAFGVQKLLITIGGYWLISLFLTTVVVGWAWLCLGQKGPPPWLTKLLVILLMVRFAIPMVTIGTDLLSKNFLDAEYAESQRAIDSLSGQLAMLNAPTPAAPADSSALEKMKDWMSKNANVKTHFESFIKLAELKVEHMIRLIVIFLLQTLVIPLLLLWGLYSVVSGTFALPRRAADLAAKRIS